MGKERDDCDAGMSANNGDVFIGGVGALEFGDKARSADNVEGGNTEETLGVVNAFGLKNFCADGDRGVDLEGISKARCHIIGREQTGFAMTKTLASGAASATAFARSRTIEALVLNRSRALSICCFLE